VAVVSSWRSLTLRHVTFAVKWQSFCVPSRVNASSNFERNATLVANFTATQSRKSSKQLKIRRYIVFLLQIMSYYIILYYIMLLYYYVIGILRSRDFTGSNHRMDVLIFSALLLNEIWHVVDMDTCLLTYCLFQKALPTQGVTVLRSIVSRVLLSSVAFIQRWSWYLFAIFLWLFGTILSRNVGVLFPGDAAPYPWRTDASIDIYLLI
jgi:hypothetical protein